MWQILKAEISYNKLGIAITLAIILLMFFAALYFPIDSIYTFMPNSAIAFAIGVAAMGSGSDKEKRDRLFVLLPFTIRKLSIARWLFIIVLQLILFAISLLLYSLVSIPESSAAIWSMISFHGFVLTSITLFVIFHDLGFFHTGKYRGFFLWVLLGVLLLTYFVRPDFSYVKMIEIKEALYVMAMYKSLFTSSTGSAISMVICLGVLVLSCRIFQRRKSYLA